MRKLCFKAKVKLILLIAMLMLPLVHAEQTIDDSELFLLQDLVVNIDAKADVDIIRQEDATLTRMKAEVLYFPREEPQQQILSFNMVGSPYLGKDSIIYEFSGKQNSLSGMDSFTLGYDGTIRKERHEEFIRQKIPFPLKNIPEEVFLYTQPTENIDSGDKDIRSQAVKIAADEDDLYILEYKLAEWVRKNVHYNLSTATADISQKASWVLEEREGVCDEISSLFIAMNRALGIPARFVSGIAYTNSDLFEERWGPHGWAEVYFPGVGWVPYDVTYGEIGFVDASHLTLMTTLDGTDPSVKYEWLGNGVDITPQSLEPKVTLVQKGKTKNPAVSMKVSVLQQNVGIGSYNAVIVTMQNNADHYETATLYFSPTESLEMLGKTEETVLLRPRSSVKVHKIVKVSDRLSPQFVYTFPVGVQTSAGTEGKAVFEVQKQHSSLTQQEIEKVLGTQEQKEYYFETSCSYESIFLVGEEIGIECTIENIDSKAHDTTICLENDCREVSFPASETMTESFKRVAQLPARKNYLFLTITAKNLEERSYVIYDVVEQPEVQITEVNYERQVAFGVPFIMNFTLAPASTSPVTDVHVTLRHKGREISWDIDSLQKEKALKTEMDSGIFGLKGNAFILTVDYHDKDGKPYTKQEIYTVELKDLTPIQWFLALLNSFG